MNNWRKDIIKQAQAEHKQDRKSEKYRKRLNEINDSLWVEMKDVYHAFDTNSVSHIKQKVLNRFCRFSVWAQITLATSGRFNLIKDLFSGQMFSYSISQTDDFPETVTESFCFCELAEIAAALKGKTYLRKFFENGGWFCGKWSSLIVLWRGNAQLASFINTSRLLRYVIFRSRRSEICRIVFRNIVAGRVNGKTTTYTHLNEEDELYLVKHAPSYLIAHYAKYRRLCRQAEIIFLRKGKEKDVKTYSQYHLS